jgi:hypothetical protein
VPPAEPLTEPVLPAPAVVFDVVFVDWLALVLWLVVALGLMLTVLCGIALKFASVFTVVFALGAVDCPATVPVLLFALFLPFPLPSPAAVFDVVFVDWFAAVDWLVVALGVMLTVLCGIALKRASVLVVVFAVGAVDWPAVVLVVLPALFCAIAPLLSAAATAAAAMVRQVFRIMWFSSREC